MMPIGLQFKLPAENTWFEDVHLVFYISSSFVFAYMLLCVWQTLFIEENIENMLVVRGHM